MPQDSIKKSQRMAYRVIADLYRHHPVLVTLDHGSVGDIQNRNDGLVICDPDKAAERGILVWLHREKWVSGELMEHAPLNAEPTVSIVNAQLTNKALYLLEDVDTNLGGKLGDKLVEFQGTRHEPTAAERLYQRMTRH